MLPAFLRLAAAATTLTLVAAPAEWSGIYPSLAYFNNEGECGTGAVVPWADRLWVITYAPHQPFGSSDKLYEITPDLELVVRPESVGGTPANRLIHRESNQLIIGPYFIDAERKVRVIPPKLMPGRLTGNARHLTDPANKVYFATMEDGLYEVDVRTLAVKGLIKEIMNKPKPGQTAETDPATITSTLPGYHGKGLYSGQGQVILANNGENTPTARTDPATVSGGLGSFNGEGNWSLIRRNQFTEVTGPGGLTGNADPAKDPIWTVGWDFRSLILMVMEDGKWTSFRLPKGSHSYDGAHGWNTEWPRIRDIGEEGSRLMTMHGLFWTFPAGFSAKQSAGLAPRSAYLKVIGDFTRWQDRLVFGCDDTAKSEFLNKRAAKGTLGAPGQSQSNLWFTPLDATQKLGPALGRGGVWVDEPVKAGVASDAFLFAGFAKRALFLGHDGAAATRFTLEVDRRGDGQWTALREVPVAAGIAGEWLQFLDADDYLEPEKLARQFAEADGGAAADVIYSPTWMEDTRTGHRERGVLDPTRDLYVQWITWQLPQTGGCLWRRSALDTLGGWKESQPCCQEHELYLRALQAGLRFVFAPTPHAVYRLWSEETVCRRDPRMVIRLRTALIDALQSWMQERGLWRDEHRQAAGRACFEMSRTLAKTDLRTAAAYHRDRAEHGLIHVSGPSAPPAYRIARRLVGFTGAEKLAAMRR